MRRNGSAVTSLFNRAGSYIGKALAEMSQEKKLPPRKPSRYKSQEKLTKILEAILECRAETEKSFPWLISPRGGRLKIDIYFEKFNLAVEYHGKQHAEFPNAFHKTAEDFRYAAMCDAWKLRELRRRGVTVIEFGHTEKLTKQAVAYKLRKLGVQYGGH